MKATGFSFSCPCTVRSRSWAFDQFIKTATNEPRKIYNPWPLLAGLKSFYQARTQPLIRTSYYPTAKPLVGTSDFRRYGKIHGYILEEMLTRSHERYHITSDFAPAKVLARSILGLAFENLTVLLRGHTWDSKMEESWNKISRITYCLSTICKSIALSEELLATALSIEEELKFHPVSYHKLEDEILANSTNLPRFFVLYYPTFKRVARWVMEKEVPLILCLEIFLQGIKMSRSSRAIRLNSDATEGMLIADSAKRCRMLAESVNTMSSGKELFNWLVCTTTKSHEVDWYYQAMDSITMKEDLSEEMYILQKFTLGESELVSISGTDPPMYIPHEYRPSGLIEAELYAHEIDRGWYIIYDFKDNNHSREEVDALVRVLAFESLLEQLSSGNGICCPHYDPVVGCVCDPDWRESLDCILRWAREGKFDQGNFNLGNWTDLPKDCRI